MTAETAVNNNCKHVVDISKRWKGFSGNWKGLSGNQIKLIAIIAMTIDHLTSVIFVGYPKQWYFVLMHIIGRLAAPLMWFMVAEGFHYTRNIKKYAGRLFVFAIVSHFAYNFCFGIPFIPFQTGLLNQTSVIWPLAWAVVVLYVHEKTEWKEWVKTLFTIGVSVITFCSDWGCLCMLVILYLYRYRNNLKRQIFEMEFYIFWYALGYALAADKVYGAIQMLVILSFPVMKCYNGERGEWKGMKWFFYAYYVGHLVLCGILRIILHGNVGVIIGG